MSYTEYLFVRAVQSERGLRPHYVTVQILSLGVLGTVLGMAGASVTSLPYFVPAYCLVFTVLFVILFEIVERKVPAGVTARRDI